MLKSWHPSISWMLAPLSATVLVAPPAASQLDQVYDVNPPVYEERELNSVAADTNEEVWPNRSFLFDSTVEFESDQAIGDAYPFAGATMLYEGQPVPDIYRQDFTFESTSSDEDAAAE